MGSWTFYGVTVVFLSAASEDGGISVKTVTLLSFLFLEKAAVSLFYSMR